MSLVRVNGSSPARYSRGIFDGFDRVFEDLASPLFGQIQAVDYPVDLYETDDQVVLEMAVPGLTGEDLDISIEGRSLSIRGRVPRAESEGRRYWVQSIPRADVTRTVKLPGNVVGENIEARVRDGMLRLSMPKAAEAKVRKIEVLQD